MRLGDKQPLVFSPIRLSTCSNVPEKEIDRTRFATCKRIVDLLVTPVNDSERACSEDLAAVSDSLTRSWSDTAKRKERWNRSLNNNEGAPPVGLFLCTGEVDGMKVKLGQPAGTESMVGHA